MLHEFAEPLLVETELGKGQAIFVDTGAHEYYYTVVLENRAIVTVAQSKLLVQRDYTNNRGVTRGMILKAVARLTEKLDGYNARGQDQGASTSKA